MSEVVSRFIDMILAAETLPIHTIKLVREKYGLGLKDAFEAVNARIEAGRWQELREEARAQAKPDLDHVCTADDCCTQAERAARHELRRVRASQAPEFQSLTEQIRRMREASERPIERIPEIMAVLEAAWTANPNQRLLQLLVNVCDARPNPLFNMEDDALLAKLSSHIVGSEGTTSSQRIATVLGASRVVPLADLARELEAYKRAKAENDERFMIERDQARLERDEARRERDEAIAERDNWKESQRLVSEFATKAILAVTGVEQSWEEIQIETLTSERDDLAAELAALHGEKAPEGWTWDGYGWNKSVDTEQGAVGLRVWFTDSAETWWEARPTWIPNGHHQRDKATLSDGGKSRRMLEAMRLAETEAVPTLLGERES